MADEYKEVVRFVGNDEESTHLIHESCTTIFSSTGSHNKGSSKLTLKNFVNYSWGQYYYRGQLIALHIGEKFLAYAFTKPDTSEGLVRIVKIDHDNYSRALIKGFSTAVEDISFAHIYEIIMLACIDQSGNIYIYVVKEDIEMQTIKAFPVFQINGDPQFCYANKHLITWCQFIPEQINYLKMLEFEPLYKGKILAIVRGSDVEVWHIGMASSQTAGPVYGNFELNTTLDKNVLNNIKSSVIKFSLSDSDVVGVSFSPDGSNISIAFSNGSIFFYQISFETSRELPKCVFNWHPDDVFLSLRAMLFLDNRKHVVGDIEMWKYVVTFSSHNELILWSCETWKHLQKLKFIRPYNTSNPMKLSVDGTGRYLFLSDIDNNLLYVMEISADINSPKKNIKIVSVSEILLHSPMLNMIILNTKIDHNEVDFLEPDDILNGVKKCSTIINLFAIQPKSLQEGQLIISSPVISIKEQIIESNKIEPTKIFPKAPTLDTLMDSINISQGNSEVIKTYEEKGNLIELTSMEVHCLVKEKLRLKGININPNSSASIQQIKSLQNMQSHTFNTIQPISAVQPSNSGYSKNVFELELNEIRECSPINNEVQQILTQNPEDLQYNYEHVETHSAENRSFEESSFIDVGKEEALCFSGGSVFNTSSISTIRQPTDKSEIDTGIVNQIDDIYSCLQDINSQLKWLTKKQKKIDTQLSNSLLTNKAADLLSKNLEPALTNVIKNASEQANKKLQMIMEHQLAASQKKIADIARNSNQTNTELVTRSLVASLSPTLDAILKDLFMSTVIPKFEQACVSMFNQIDTHITHLTHLTERSLEYQNELKLLLNEEGNINNKLEYAFDKFTDDMTGIIKISEKKILNAQTEMQEHFAGLIKEKTLSHVESFVKDSEPVVNQYLMLSEILDRGDVIGAFEKALCASNLDLVIFVCEKIHPEDFFHQSSMLGIPIVLSLIQQLSHDLVKNTELKHAYLEAAVSYLDDTNDSHRETINKVLIKMNNSVDKFLQYYPAHPYGRKLKMLQLAVKSIINIKNLMNSSVN